MTHLYDRIATEYDQTFQTIPFRGFVERYSIVKNLGSLQDMQALDVACGTGYYARLMRQLGARHVAGVDISAEMIAVSQQTEAAMQLGNLTFIEQDIATLEPIGSFDVALGVYLLHYARDRQHLDAMCRSIAHNLVPGARLLTAVMNPDLATTPDYYQVYHMAIYARPDMKDGEEFGFAFELNGVFTDPIPVWHWKRATLEDALQQAGFEQVQVKHLELDPAAIEADGTTFWQPILDYPTTVLLSAIRR